MQYADAIIDTIDPKGLISHRRYQHHCTEVSDPEQNLVFFTKVTICTLELSLQLPILIMYAARIMQSIFASDNLEVA